MGKAEYLLTYPRVFFVFALILLWLSAQLGAFLRRWWPMKDDLRDDFSIVQTATLTLLGLIIGFSFSMAISRYDLRKNYEEEEANAIGTEYVRADLIPTSGAAALRIELKNYLDLRILFYRTRDEIELRQISADTTRLAGRDVVRSSGSSCGATYTRDRSRGFGDERCAEFAGIHPGSMVEPHSSVGMGFNDSDRHL